MIIDLNFTYYNHTGMNYVRDFRGKFVFHLATAKQDSSYYYQVCIGHWQTFCLLLCFWGGFPIAKLAFPLVAFSEIRIVLCY